ncbi:monovalent cation/H+ antiporter complex subunit F [Halorussus caseinilyticus]|uniref:Monovalent cation/H+ antiporter complex subunit F n=1 Tax=Halorussus caseinilyticus TaxID=3034025 RepID=A0ABD5WLG1_9EURY|nr:monovalent cation/H+ antiporter complex subunit F [Halorussus sp. DT72]
MTDAPTDFLLGVAVVLVALAGVVGYRVVVGPTLQDRVVAVNALGTTAVVVLALLAAALDDPGLLDVALAYGLLNFLLSVGLARVLGEQNAPTAGKSPDADGGPR